VLERVTLGELRELVRTYVMPSVGDGRAVDVAVHRVGRVRRVRLVETGGPKLGSTERDVTELMSMRELNAYVDGYRAGYYAAER
jgi:hypothetical protein